ncbi:MAG: hypothetical protein U5L00_05005 [Desulfovermiculus sp.]|nr:hypothetical protein [Desulfovermiculus sp.]
MIPKKPLGLDEEGKSVAELLPVSSLMALICMMVNQFFSADLMTSARSYQPFVKNFKLCFPQKEAGTTARINHFVAIRVIRGPRSFMIELFCGRS